MEERLRFLAQSTGIASSQELIESVISCHDAQVVEPYQVSIALHLTVLVEEKSEDYTAAQQHLQIYM